jgi:PAS domain S-box-containing protein
MPSEATRDKYPFHLLLIFLFLSAGIIVSGYLYYHNYEKQYRAKVEQELSGIAEMKIDELVDWKEERLKDAAVFYKNDNFSIRVRQYLAAPENMEAKTKLRTWMYQFHADSQYSSLFLLDPHGVKRMSVPDTPEPAAPHLLQNASEALRSGKVVFLDFHRDGPAQPIHLSILVPILDTQEHNRAIGVLVLRIDPEKYLYAFIKRWPTLSQTAETLIVRRDGNDALFLNELRFQKNTALNLRIPLESIQTPAVKAVLGQKGIDEGIDYRGVPVIADIRPVPDSPWFLVTRMDTSEVYNPLREKLWEILILIGALLICAAAGTGFVWRQQRTRFYRERYEAAEALRESETQFRAMFEVASIGIAQADISTGQWLRVNEKMCAITGYSAEEMLRMRVPEITHPDDRQRDWEAFQRVVRGESPNYHIEKRYIRKDGSIVWVNVNKTVIRDAEGKPLRTMTAIEDITERRYYEEKLRYLSSRQEAILAAVPDIIMEVDSNKMYTWANKTGYEFFGDDVLGKKASFYFEGEQTTYEAVQPLFNGWENIIYIESWQRRKDGEKRLLAWWCRVLKDTEGNVSGALSTARDITELKKAEEEIRKLNEDLEQRVIARTAELEAANKELEAFSYSVSHDLRAPLRHLAGFVELLKDRTSGSLDEKSVHYLNVLQNSAGQMGYLIDDLLAFSRIGRAELIKTTVDLGKMINDVMKELSEEMKGRKVAWNIHQMPVVYGDRSMLKLVVINLIANALKFTRKKELAEIEIGYSEGQDEITVYVRDNGVGFDMRYVDKLFNVFQRLHRKEEFEGTGIGLANVHRIIKKHGGRTWAEGKVNEGAMFSFSLPRLQTEDHRP